MYAIVKVTPFPRESHVTDENLAGGLPVERLRAGDSGDSSGIGEFGTNQGITPPAGNPTLIFWRKYMGNHQLSYHFIIQNLP